MKKDRLILDNQLQNTNMVAKKEKLIATTKKTSTHTHATLTYSGSLYIIVQC
jgi:hypothetical protein